MELDKTCKWCGGGLRKAGKRYGQTGSMQLYECAKCHRVSGEYAITHPVTKKPVIIR